MQNRKSNGNPHLKMNLSGTDRQNSKWIDSKHFQNMVLCTFTVPNSVPEPVPECGYGWEPVDLNEGRKCVQHNYYSYLHEEAVTHCEAQGARLAQPKNDEDNKALSDAYGYKQKNPDNQTLSIWLAAAKADGKNQSIEKSQHRRIILGRAVPLFCNKRGAACPNVTRRCLATSHFFGTKNNLIQLRYVEGCSRRFRNKLFPLASSSARR